MGDLGPLHDLRGSFEDRIRILPDEAVHVHPRVQLEDARVVVRVLPDFLQGGSSAVLPFPALIQARLGIAAAEQDDPFRPPPARRPDAPYVPGEGILLQIEEQLLQRVRAAPRRADEFSLWEEEVLGRNGTSEGSYHPLVPSKKVPT